MGASQARPAVVAPQAPQGEGRAPQADICKQGPCSDQQLLGDTERPSGHELLHNSNLKKMDGIIFQKRFK